ncbi:MAG: amino acid--tRNA ligase-related protein [Patescibacteria group bacterium]|nr:amino acid--tRNA ligase-related protein [Patescibacteria group bacterium]
MKRTFIKETLFCVGKKIKVSGFVNSVRLHGKIIFFDIRDFSGVLQTVIISNNSFYEEAKKIRTEWVVEVVGEVKERPEKMKNNDIETGSVEMEIEEIKILSEAETLPFAIETDGYEINEEIRMRHRYLDIRRERVKKNLSDKHNIILFCRNFLDEKGFLEVETPILTKSTPEGARDFLVPSRLQAGSFYALPQSPQQYKQLLMVGGIERYFQFARCFRDEDFRADRQAEFTQLDIELSFIDKEYIMNLVEEMTIEIVNKFFPEKKIQQVPFPRIPYDEAMDKWREDRPDIRKNKEDENELAFAFVVDFPMFEKNKEGKWNVVHHPFTKPDEDDLEKIKSNPEKVRGLQYDLVLNGSEIAGGSIRSNQKEVLEAVFSVLGHKKDEIEKMFGHLLEAFSFGAPPHGGIAFGFERFLSILLNEKNIREVIAFPKTGDARDLVMGAPSSDIKEKQLNDLHIKRNEKQN